jgi:hypothetical protein
LAFQNSLVFQVSRLENTDDQKPTSSKRSTISITDDEFQKTTVQNLCGSRFSTDDIFALLEDPRLVLQTAYISQKTDRGETVPLELLQIKKKENLQAIISQGFQLTQLVPVGMVRQLEDQGRSRLSLNPPQVSLSSAEQPSSSTSSTKPSFVDDSKEPVALTSVQLSDRENFEVKLQPFLSGPSFIHRANDEASILTQRKNEICTQLVSNDSSFVWYDETLYIDQAGVYLDLRHSLKLLKQVAKHALNNKTVAVDFLEITPVFIERLCFTLCSQKQNKNEETLKNFVLQEIGGVKPTAWEVFYLVGSYQQLLERKYCNDDALLVENLIKESQSLTSAQKLLAYYRKMNTVLFGFEILRDGLLELVLESSTTSFQNWNAELNRNFEEIKTCLLKEQAQASALPVSFLNLQSDIRAELKNCDDLFFNRQVLLQKTTFLRNLNIPGTAEQSELKKCISDNNKTNLLSNATNQLLTNPMFLKNLKEQIETCHFYGLAYGLSLVACFTPAGGSLLAGTVVVHKVLPKFQSWAKFQKQISRFEASIFQTPPDLPAHKEKLSRLLK